jgi:hypothetical protein
MTRFAVAVVVLAALSGKAAERDFPLTSTTQTLGVGHHDLEGWLTPRIARKLDSFAMSEARLAMTAGVTGWLETTVSLDLDFLSSPEVTTVDPRLSTVWKFAPFKATDAVGFGWLVRGSIGPDNLALEARLFADKAFGRLLLAVNASYERSFFWSQRTGIDTRLEGSAAGRFALGDQATFGMELRLKGAFQRADYQGTGIYVGPCLSVRVAHTWFSIGAFAQVAADKAKADKGNGEPLELRDNERFVLRLIVGGHTD